MDLSYSSYSSSTQPVFPGHPTYSYDNLSPQSSTYGNLSPQSSSYGNLSPQSFSHGNLSPQSSSYAYPETHIAYLVQPPAKRQRRDETAEKKSRIYQRYPKPPYSYVGMIIAAIETSPEKNITLSELTTSLQNMFSFFRGSYKGWKDSIRHTLTSSPCLIRTDMKRNSTSVWKTDLTKAPTNVFKRQETEVSKGGDWAPTLHEQLNIPEIELKSPEFNFSIDHLLTDTLHLAADHGDDSRRRYSFSNDSPVFTQRTISLNYKKNTTKRSPKSLQQELAKVAESMGISQDQAIENLSLLCNSMPTVCTTPTRESNDQQASSPVTRSPQQQSSVLNSVTTPPSTDPSSVSSYSPIIPTTFSPPASQTISSTSPGSQTPTFAPLYPVVPSYPAYTPTSTCHPAHLYDQSYYSPMTSSSFYHHSYYVPQMYNYPSYYQQHLDNQYPMYHVDTRRQSIQPLDFSSTSSASSSSSPALSDES